jgi:hypothetical protein
MPQIKILVLCFFSLALSCFSKPKEDSESRLVLKAYEVPRQGAPQLRRALADLFFFGSAGGTPSTSIGKVDVAPDGQLMVLAPESVHAGVRALIDSTFTAAPKPISTVTLTYWVVMGTSGKTVNPLTAGLADVSAALSEIEKHDGPMSFELIEKIDATSLSGEEADVKGRATAVTQRGTLVDGLFTGMVRINHPPQSMNTQVRIATNQLVVLASSGLAGKTPDDTSRSVYFLVRAAESNANVK